MDRQPSFSRYDAPHVRLNSGSDDLLQMSHYNGPRIPQPPIPQPPPRSLTSPLNTSYNHYAKNNPFFSHESSPTDTPELLFPPRQANRRFRDDDSETRSPVESGFNSRRTSCSSSIASRGSRSLRRPLVNPFDDSRPVTRDGSDDEAVNTQTVSEKYNILPSAGLLLFPEDVEKDDYMHEPDPNDRDPRITCADLCSSRGLVNIGGLAFITLGLLILFIGYPILTFVRNRLDPSRGACELDPLCLKANTPLLKNLRTGLIDPDTPDSAKARKDINGRTMNLVFSDEFEQPGRTFYEGDDHYFTAVDLWYGVTGDLEWYDPDAVTTANGTLNIRFDAFRNHNLDYRSGMLQSWNQLCFKNGYIEASISLPGRGDTSGFWPGFWAMGNLGRPGHAATTDGMWPFSYHDKCDAGSSYNQSDPDGLSYLPAMRLPACSCVGEDHPTPGTSRSSPEIDVIEASVGYLDPQNARGAIGSASQSFQVAPFDVLWRPNTDGIELYDHRISSMNSYQGGNYQQALSTVTNLNNDWYDGKQYQTYGFEYKTGDDGYIVWNVGNKRTWKVTADAIGPNGNIGQRVIPEEPLSIIANFGMSESFAMINKTLRSLMPATMRFDYIRIYQDGDGEMTCDPDGYPTTDYIAAHPEPYYNPNLTEWSHTGYSTPKSSIMNGCKAAKGQSSRQMLKDKKLKKRGIKTKRSITGWT